jgi:hypothetical protein
VARRSCRVTRDDSVDPEKFVGGFAARHQSDRLPSGACPCGGGGARLCNTDKPRWILSSHHTIFGAIRELDSSTMAIASLSYSMHKCTGMQVWSIGAQAAAKLCLLLRGHNHDRGSTPTRTKKHGVLDEAHRRNRLRNIHLVEAAHNLSVYDLVMDLTGTSPVANDNGHPCRC